MTRTALLRRLRYLRNGEFFNVLFLPAVLALGLVISDVPTWALYAYTMGMICFILLQGGTYWHLKLRIVQGDAGSLPAWFGPRYAAFRRINVVLLALYPVLAAVAVAAGRSRGWEPFWATLLALFAGLEYTNYYHWQLMYDSAQDLRWLCQHRRLRRAHLAEDLVAWTL
ncbi:MAG: hypothetical protein JXC32_17030 [Anaerolineae bacterium]|nr:hypothetical protein [Anaerolineae bacterium]